MATFNRDDLGFHFKKDPGILATPGVLQDLGKGWRKIKKTAINCKETVPLSTL